MTSSSRPAKTFAFSATSFIFSTIAALLVIGALAACAGPPVTSAGPPTIPFNKNAKKTMRAFGSEEELKAYFKRLAEQQTKEIAKRKAQAPPAPTTGNQSAHSAPKEARGL